MSRRYVDDVIFAMASQTVQFLYIGLFFSKTATKLKHFGKVYFNVWDLKLEILSYFDTVLCHLHGVTFKHISNALKTI